MMEGAPESWRKFHFSGKFYNIVQYGVSTGNEQIDMDEVRNLAENINRR